MFFSKFAATIKYQQNSINIDNASKKNTLLNLLLLLLFFSGLVFLLIRAPYGFCYNDEAFCVTLGQRLYNGDALIAHEWHGCQLFSAIMLPFYATFRLFSNSNEGILLVFRYCYCAFWWISSIIVAIIIGKRYWQTALIFLFLLFFSPLDYMTISYTSMGLISALAISCILYRIPTDIHCVRIRTGVVFSLFWAILVLCSPFTLAAYIGMLVVSVIGCCYEKKRHNGAYFQNLLSVFGYALIIDIMLAVVYVMFFLLGRAEFFTIIESIPHILADPEHQSDGLMYSTLELVRSVIAVNPVYILGSILVFLFALTAKPHKSRILLFAVCAGLYFFSQIEVLRKPFNFNVQMLHIVFLGAVAFSLMRNRNWKLFLCTYSTAVWYSLLNGLASNTGIMAVSMTATVAGCSAILFIIQLLNELKEQYQQHRPLRILSSILVCCVLCFQISSELYVKLTRQYWDSPPHLLTETISCGAAKGLKTTPDNARDYSTNYYALTQLLSEIDTTGKRFLSCTSAPYLYLDADLDFATFSAWSFGYGDGLNERILTYQSINPERIPDIIYCAHDKDKLLLIDENYSQYEYNGHYLFVRNETGR